MNLKELNRLEAEAYQLDREAMAAKEAETIFSSIRTGDKPLFEEMMQGNLRYREKENIFIKEIINELGVEILRIAELRKESHARTCKVKADALRSAITSALGPQNN